MAQPREERGVGRGLATHIIAVSGGGGETPATGSPAYEVPRGRRFAARMSKEFVSPA